MKLVDWKEGEIVLDQDGIVGRRLYGSPEAEIIHIEVAPGRAISPHVTPVDMEFFVLEGRGLFILGEESREARAGTLVPSPRGVPHGLRNLGTDPLRILAIKNPQP